MKKNTCSLLLQCRETLTVTWLICVAPRREKLHEKFPLSTCLDWHAGVRTQQHFELSVMCKKQEGGGGGKHYMPFSLLAPFTRSHWRFPQWCWSPFLQEKKLSKQEVVTNLKSFLACFFVGCFSLFTWARSTFQNNIINGNVTPYWRTPDRFKHNLGQKDK